MTKAFVNTMINSGMCMCACSLIPLHDELYEERGQE